MVAPAVQELETYFGIVTQLGGRKSRWDVFNNDGRFLTTVALPQRFLPMAVRRQTVYGILKDDLDVEFVVAYEVSPS